MTAPNRRLKTKCRLITSCELGSYHPPTFPASIFPKTRVFAVGQLKVGKGGEGGRSGRPTFAFPRLRRLSPLWPVPLQKLSGVELNRLVSTTGPKGERVVRKRRGFA